MDWFLSPRLRLGRGPPAVGGLHSNVVSRDHPSVIAPGARGHRATLDTHLSFQKQVSMQSAIDLASSVLAEGVGGDNPELKS